MCEIIIVSFALSPIRPWLVSPTFSSQGPSFYISPSLLQLFLPVFLSDEERREEVHDFLPFRGWELLQVFYDSINEDLGSPCPFLGFLRFSG